MRRLIPAILIAASLLTPHRDTLAAANLEVSGRVEGRVLLDTGQPAVGSNVLLRDTRFGASAGEDGTFVVNGVPPGTYAVVARLVGYEMSEPALVTVRPGGSATVTLRLRPSAIELNTVTVTGTRRQSAEDTRSSVTTLSPAENKKLPGAGEDVLRALQAIPGVTSVNDFSSQLVVRGSGPDQNLILIDGFEALNPYRLYGFVSMFNPETVSDISLQTGGFAAQYGDRLSAVLDVKNREGRSDVTAAGKLNVSLTNMNLVLEGALPAPGSSFLVSARRTYYDLILGPVLSSAGIVKGDVALPNFRDFQGKLMFPLGGNHKLILTGFTSRDGADVVSGAERDRPDSVNVFDTSYNTLLGATWKFNPSRQVILATRLSWYRNDGSGVFSGRFVDPAQNTGDLGRTDTVGLRFVAFGVDYAYRYQKTTLAQQILWDAGAHTVEAGWGIDFLRTDFTRFFTLDEGFKNYILARGQVVPTDVTDAVSYERYNLYLQDRIRLGNRLAVQPGLRLDYYPVLRQPVTVAPRVNVSYGLSDLSTLRAAYGIFYQSPGMEKWDFRSPLIYTRETFAGVVAERAEHYILGFDRMVSPEWQLKLDVYYKTLSDVIGTEKLQGTDWFTAQTGSDPRNPASWAQPVLAPMDSATSVPVNAATGTSKGFEVLFQKIQSLPEDRFTGWIGYALASSQRLRDGVNSPFLFDQRHAMTAVGNYRFAERWDVGLRFTLRSGRPYADATGVSPRVVYQDGGGVPVPIVQTDANGNVVLDVQYETDRYSGRMNLYHSLDLRITTYPRWFDLDWAVYLDVQNVYNRQNEQAVNFYVDAAGGLRKRPVYGLPIFPSLGLTVSF